jgi:hypothetical protein
MKRIPGEASVQILAMVSEVGDLVYAGVSFALVLCHQLLTNDLP